MEDNDLAMRFAVKEGLHNTADLNMKRMGGVLSGTWGALLPRTRTDKATYDGLARWTITEVRGRGKACLSCFSTYRSYRGATALAGDGLVARECRAYGWTVNAANLARTEKAYFDDLGTAIAQKLAAGHEVIVGGDINIDRTREKEFRKWLTEVGLVDTGADDSIATFRHPADAGSRLDFILVSQGLNKLRTCKPEVRTVGHTEHWGHRAVVLDLTDPITQFLGLRKNELNWKEHRARARKLARDQQPPPRIDKNRKEEFKKRVEGKVQADTTLQAYIGTVQGISTWGTELWEMKRGPRQDWTLQPTLVAEGRWTLQPPRQPSELERDLGHRMMAAVEQEGRQEALADLTATEILRIFDSLASHAEDRVNKIMAETAWSFGQADAPKSRRKMDGWYPDLQHDRKLVNRADRLVDGARARKFTAMARLARNWITQHRWEGPAPPATPTGKAFEDWLLDLVHYRANLKRQVQGRKRKAQRASISEAVKAREEAFEKGN